MAHNQLDKSSQYFFLNSGLVRGVQNVQVEYSVDASPIVFAGGQVSIYTAQTPQIGNISLNCLLVNSDPFFQYTGISGFDGFLLQNKENIIDNVSFTSGYLSSYQIEASIGAIPQLSCGIVCFGDVGRLELEDSEDYLTNIPNSTGNYNINIVDPGAIQITLDDISLNRVNSFSLSYQLNRRPDFILGSKFPERVHLTYPIETNCSFQINAKDYINHKIRSFPENPTLSDITISLREYKTNTTLRTYNLTNMILEQESYSSNINSESLVNLTYRGFIYEYDQEDIVSDGLIIFHRQDYIRCFRSGFNFLSDLTANERTGVLFGVAPTLVNNHFVFDGINDYVDISGVNLGGDCTIAAWIKSSSPNGKIPISINADNFSSGPNLYFVSSKTVWNTADGSSNVFSLNGVDLGLPANAWYYYAVTSDSINGQASIYVNGVLSGVADYKDTKSENSVIRYGGEHEGSAFFTGNIDYVAVWDRVLTPLEILQSYNATRFT